MEEEEWRWLLLLDDEEALVDAVRDVSESDLAEGRDGSSSGRTRLRDEVWVWFAEHMML